MEPISTVASIVTLVALTKEICVLTNDLTRGLHSAPAELARLRRQTSLIFLELQYLESEEILRGIGSLLSLSEIGVFTQVLKAAKDSLSAVHDGCKALGCQNVRAKRRLKWVLFEKKRSEEYLQHLQQAESSLAVILQLVNISGKASLKVFSESQQQFGKTQDSIQALRTELQFQAPSATTRVGQSNTITPHFGTSQRYLSAMKLPEFWTWLLGCEFLLVVISTGSGRNYNCYTRVQFPTPVGKMALVLWLSLHRSSLSWFDFFIRGGRLSLVNSVAITSDIVVACRKGDLVAVREMFRLRKASPTDASNQSLLWYATESGSTELVEFLISQGAPMTPGVLLAAAFWRQPEIARLCLRNGADVEVLGANGSTAAIMLFGSSRKPEPQTELIEILACNSFQNFDAQDTRGWTALHRAAAFGTSDDVKALLLMKASVDVRTHNLQWTPLFCAVCFSNLETMQELWTCYNDPSQTKDLRGWNLLHVAAAAGNFAAVPFLLKKGVDLNGISQATSRFVPASLASLSVKPGYMARNCGEESYGAWCEVLRSEGYEPDVSPSTIDWMQEEYREKFGGCECCETWGF